VAVLCLVSVNVPALAQDEGVGAGDDTVSGDAGAGAGAGSDAGEDASDTTDGGSPYADSGKAVQFAAIPIPSYNPNLGWAFDSISQISTNDALPSIGTGIRYMMISSYKINVGVDVAAGKDETVLYFRIGEAF